MPDKRLILIRHAHRDTSERDADNGLSEKGWEQAHELAKHFAKSFKAQKPRLVSSAKTRCRETLEPISHLTGVKIKTDPRLMEQEHDEKFGSFERRIEDFIEDWKEQGAPLTLACSHGDWLPFALEALTGEQIDMKKGAWAELTLNGSKVNLKDLIQKF